jgi:succinyl-diaminopimelate desuccinylase
MQVDVADPVPLAQALIRCASVTPADAGAMAVLSDALRALGAAVHAVPFGTTPNLVAVLGEGHPHFCFAGHTDVVPPGEGWSHGPFDGVVADGVLYGRGTCDMKGAVAAFVAAIGAVLADGPLRGRISLLITGDEEGPAQDGTKRVLDWMAERDLVPDVCLVGEPTNPARLGDMIKIGRRGSLNATITVHGVQGHVAYPHRADNPVHRLLAALSALAAHRLDDGTAWFEPSSLQVVSVDVANAAFNVIPAQASARLNIRFNDRHTGAGLEAWLRGVIGAHAARFDLAVAVSGEAFRTEASGFAATVVEAVAAVTGVTPRLDTGGGTSDARFISRFCPTVEFGLVGASMHRVDENVPLADLLMLRDVYAAVLRRVLA